MSQHPIDGIRVQLILREGEAEGGARYAAAIFTPTEQVDFELAIDGAGAVSATPVDEQRAAALPDRARDLLRQIARTVAKHAISEAPHAWPRRVLRWRRVS